MNLIHLLFVLLASRCDQNSEAMPADEHLLALWNDFKGNPDQHAWLLRAYGASSLRLMPEVVAATKVQALTRGWLVRTGDERTQWAVRQIEDEVTAFRARHGLSDDELAEYAEDQIQDEIEAFRELHNFNDSSEDA